MTLSVRADQIGGFLGDHDGRGICVAADQRRHDRCVGHAQTGDTPHAQLGIDHCHRIALRPHLAGSYRVILGVGAGANIRFHSGGVVDPGRIQHLAAEPVEGLRIR